MGWIFLSTPLLRGDLVVVQKVEEGGSRKQACEITIKIKDAKVRADISPEISVIMDTASGETTTLHHGQKTYLKVGADAVAQLLKGMERTRDERLMRGITEEPPKLEDTGKRETIAGQETKIYSAQAGSIKMTWWIAPKTPDSERFLGMLATLQKSPMAKLASGMTLLPDDLKFPGVPVKTEMAMPDGRKISMTIVSMKEESLEAIDFSIPPGYRALPSPRFGPSFSPSPP